MADNSNNDSADVGQNIQDRQTRQQQPQDVQPKQSRPVVQPIILGDLSLPSATTQLTVATTGSGAALPALPSGYLVANIGNASQLIPYYDVGTGAATNTWLLSSTFLNAAGYIIGSIVQIVTFSTGSSTTSSGTAFTATALTASITPKATTHKIRITASGELGNTVLASSNAFATIERGTTDLSSGNGFQGLNTAAGVPAGSIRIPCTMVIYDSPATISATSYTVYIKSSVAGDATWNADGLTSMIILEEIAQ